MSQSPKDDDIQRLVGNAQAYLDAGEVTLAIAALQQAFKIDRGNLRARTLFGFCALREKDIDTAEQNFRFVLKKQPENESARRGMRLLTDLASTIAESPAAAAAARPAASPAAARGRKRPGFFVIAGTYILLILLSNILIQAAVAILWNVLAEGRTVPFPYQVNDLVYAVHIVASLAATIVAIAWARRRIARKREATAGTSGHTRAQAAARPARPSGRASGVRYVLSAILWLPLLALGGFLGWHVGVGFSGDEAGGLLGAIVGVLASQVLQIALSKRRR